MSTPVMLEPAISRRPEARRDRRPSAATSLFTAAYGLFAYVWFLVTLLYLVGFLGNLWVPRSLDAPQGLPTAWAIPVNLLLILLFAVQHSVMARPAFKRRWTAIIPQHLERSTFVLITNGIFAGLFLFWQPLPETIWEVTSAPARFLVWSLFALGLALAVISTFLIDHFELFGVRQVLAAARGDSHHPPQFHVRGMYRYVRHPLMLGFVMAFWATPHMTQGRLLFAVAMTTFILIALRLEERDLRHFHGHAYETYQRQVPMLIPLPGWSWKNPL